LAPIIHDPLPILRVWVEREQPVVGQRREELDGEEGNTAGLLLHHLR